MEVYWTWLAVWSRGMRLSAAEFEDEAIADL